jgi:TatD DNase family protein
MWADSHCHLDFPHFADELDDVVARARKNGVSAFLTIGTHLSKHAQVLRVAERYSDVWCSAGIHPHEAASEPLAGPEALVALARHPRVVGIGETGLDFYYEHSPRAEQEICFRHHIAAARETQLPLIVHTRDADPETIQILKDETKHGAFPGLIHCFTSGQALADAALEIGFYISVSGIATFKSAQAIRNVLASVPPERLLVETDAPYLAPMPHRGKRNEPAFVAHTGAVLAELKGMSVEALAAQTTANFFKLFSKATAQR